VLLEALRTIAGEAISTTLDGLRPLLADVGTQLLTTTLPAMLGRGLLAFVGLLGDWLYTHVGSLVSSLNVVTQRPPEWTTDLGIVVNGWTGMRWFATLLLVGVLVAQLAEWARRDQDGRGGTAADDLAQRISGVFVALGTIQVSLEGARLLQGFYNAALAWVLGRLGASGSLDALPGWNAVAAAGADPASPDGIAKLVLAGQVLWAFSHLVVGMAWWDVLLVLMPVALAAGAWSGSAAWFSRWSVAVVGSLVAQFALCVALGLCAGLITLATQRLDGSLVVLALLAFAMNLVIVKLARQTHAGIEALHPFAGAHLPRRRGGSAGALQTVQGVQAVRMAAGVTPVGAAATAATAAGGAVAGTVAAAGGSTASTAPMPTPPPGLPPGPFPMP